MPHYEYKVVPAPRKGRKAKGVRGAEARFAFAIQSLMNEQAGDGWEYVRAETLPSDERHGLTSAQTVYRDVLVFRRARTADEPLVDDDTLEQQDPDEADTGPDEPDDLPDTGTEHMPDDAETFEDPQADRTS